MKLAKSADTSFSGWQALANAVVVQAANDYRAALRTMKRRPILLGKKGGESTLLQAEYRIRECEGFFYSERFSLYTSVSGPFIATEIRKEIEQEG